MKHSALLFLILALVTTAITAAEFDARAAFGSVPARALEPALKRAAKEKKRVFLTFHDPKGDYNDQGLAIKYFTDLEETKKLIKENYIVVLLPRDHKDLAKYTGGMNTERPCYIILNSNGTKVKADSVYANPEEGLRIIKELIAMP